MWPDKETEIDYLNFGYMVDMVVDIATNRQLSPSTIGLYGDWGSGKSTLMRLAKRRLRDAIKKERERMAHQNRSLFVLNLMVGYLKATKIQKLPVWNYLGCPCR